MRAFAQRQNQSQKKASSSLARRSVTTPGRDHHRHRFLDLQHATSNQAVLRMLQTKQAQDRGRVTVRADVDAGVPPTKEPAEAPPKAPPAPSQKAPAAPACKYKITYANEKHLQCDPKQPRGASIQFDITKVEASGKGCPASLDGLKLTEKVSADKGCHPQQPTPGPGCTIHADKAKPLEGRIENCTDTYSVCGDDQAFLFKGCTEIITQELFVDGVPAETHQITFEIFRRGTQPSGKATRN